MTSARLSVDAPEPAAFIALRAACGWGEIAPDVAAAALSDSTLHVTVHDDGTLIGMGRVVGDGALYFYLQDIIVAPSHRGQGLGRAIVDRLLEGIAPLARPGATIGLMAAKGVEPLYHSAGFTIRPNDRLGSGMTRVVGSGSDPN